MKVQARSKATSGPLAADELKTAIAIDTPEANPSDDPVRNDALAVANRAGGTSLSPRDENVANEQATPIPRNICAGRTVTR